MSNRISSAWVKRRFTNVGMRSSLKYKFKGETWHLTTFISLWDCHLVLCNSRRCIRASHSAPYWSVYEVRTTHSERCLSTDPSVARSCRRPPQRPLTVSIWCKVYSLWAMSVNRSLSRSFLPETSTADTRTENRAPVFSFCSLIRRNNHDIAQGRTPRVCAELSVPNIVVAFPSI